MRGQGVTAGGGSSRHVQQQRQQQPRGRAEDREAAAAGGQRPQDQGVPGRRGSQTVLHPKRLQGPAADWGPVQRQPLQTPQVLLPVLRSSRSLSSVRSPCSSSSSSATGARGAREPWIDSLSSVCCVGNLLKFPEYFEKF
ncbi:hypothetical protein OJAV_G00002250 [Oryzias javanicus]|uniref:Uncharacterized protein n=1 Tax=Oryzias javanicus TaxID=123683 RepID=A0A3S2PTF4_ORYJA|nr:hypothetical protein OJAV_G00002250 [Oryzias javanicus]